MYLMLNHYLMSDPPFHAINGLFYIFCHYDLEKVGSRSDLFWLLLLFEAHGIREFPAEFQLFFKVFTSHYSIKYTIFIDFVDVAGCV